jgi:tetratricopeptide (TPR) repeat protein
MNPSDYVALNNLAIVEDSRRKYAVAESLFRRSVETGAGGATGFGNVIRAEGQQGDTAAVIRDAATMRQRYPDALSTPFVGIGILYYENHVDSLVALLSRIRAEPRADRRVSAEHNLAVVAVLRGQVNDWARFTAESRRADAELGATPPPLTDSVDAAWMDITLRGQPARGVARLDALLKRIPLNSVPPLDRPYFDVATTYATAGRADRARAILAEYGAEIKDSALLRDREAAMHDVMGEIALAERRPQDALREFARGDTAYDGQPVACEICLPLFSARAYDQAGNRDSAIAMYERYEHLFARDWPVTVDPWYRSLAYKRLGELYENRGDTVRAAADYRQFIALWQNADPDLQPVVADARRRLAKLTSEPGRN